MMDGHDLPLALGVIRDYEALTYDEEVERQTNEIKERKNYSSLRDMILKTHETWEITAQE
jgi:2-oxoglutarate ferredoxin oxidoreductase subunit beta